jgi:hypothetical protein
MVTKKSMILNSTMGVLVIPKYRIYEFNPKLITKMKIKNFQNFGCLYNEIGRTTRSIDNNKRLNPEKIIYNKSLSVRISERIKEVELNNPITWHKIT